MLSVEKHLNTVCGSTLGPEDAGGAEGSDGADGFRGEARCLGDLNRNEPFSNARVLRSVDLRQRNDQAAEGAGGRVLDKDTQRGHVGTELHFLVELKAAILQLGILTIRELKIVGLIPVMEEFACGILSQDIHAHRSPV